MTETKLEDLSELIKLLERLTKMDHLYTNDQLKEIKGELRSAKERYEELKKKLSKGFGKK